MAATHNKNDTLMPFTIKESFDRRYDGTNTYDDDHHVECPPHTTERKLVAKIDGHVVPFLCILYLLAFLDRINIASANVYGLSKELNLTGHKYNNALVIFFIPYVLFEIPSNLLLKNLKPHVWLSGCMFFFGLVTICQGLVHSYSGLLTARFFLGLFESGMFPGCLYLIGMWYRRHEAQKRFSFFFSSTTLAGAFGGLLAAAIGKMSGMRGYLGWRWVFIIEGAFTCFVSLLFFFTLPDFPEEAKWLTSDERAYVQARLRADQGRSAAERRITVHDIGTCFKDFKLYLGGLMYFFAIVPAYAYAYFSPGIIKGYGYSAIETQLHSVPPWAAAFALAMTLAYCSDKIKHRYLVAVFAFSIALAGFAILICTHHNTKLEYAALFLCAAGTYSYMPIAICWYQMNLGGHHRRSVGSAWQIGFGNIGGIIAVYIFLSADAPLYTTGYSVCLAFIAMGLLTATAYFVACFVQNRNRDRMTRNVGLTEYEKTEMGDMSPEYRYQL